MRVLLTSATGFLGKHLLRLLTQLGYEVGAFVRNPSKAQILSKTHPSLTVFDLNDFSVRSSLLKFQPEAVINTVAAYEHSQSSHFALIESNLSFPLELHEACRELHVPLLIHTSSALPRNINRYSLSKAQADDWLELLSSQNQKSEMRVLLFKIDQMYGPEDNEDRFLSYLLKNFETQTPKIPLTHGLQERDFVYIHDVCRAYEVVLKNYRQLPAFSCFDIGSGRPLSVRLFAETALSRYVSQIGSCSSQLDFGALSSRAHEPMKVNLNPKPLEKLGWAPVTDLPSGIDKTLQKMKL